MNPSRTGSLPVSRVVAPRTIPLLSATRPLAQSIFSQPFGLPACSCWATKGQFCGLQVRSWCDREAVTPNGSMTPGSMARSWHWIRSIGVEDFFGHGGLPNMPLSVIVQMAHGPIRRWWRLPRPSTGGRGGSMRGGRPRAHRRWLECRRSRRRWIAGLGFGHDKSRRSERHPTAATMAIGLARSLSWIAFGCVCDLNPFGQQFYINQKVVILLKNSSSMKHILV